VVAETFRVSLLGTGFGAVIYIASESKPSTRLSLAIVFSSSVPKSTSLSIQIMALRILDWQKLPVTLAELCIATTLRCGQSFRFVRLRRCSISIAIRMTEYP
jgi:hypothetical protein